jgi:hypothetical protein
MRTSENRDKTIGHTSHSKVSEHEIYFELPKHLQIVENDQDEPTPKVHQKPIYNMDFSIKKQKNRPLEITPWRDSDERVDSPMICRP